MAEIEGIGAIGVIGAGIKGREIASRALLGGYRVVLEDISAVRLCEAKARIAAALNFAPPLPLIDPAHDEQTDARFSTTQSIDEVTRAADLLIEAAPEDAELQLEIFTIFDKFAKPQAILASTATSVSIADLAEMTNCPERCVRFQFPEPGTNDRVLRIICAQETNTQTLQTCKEFARSISLMPEIAGAATLSRAAREGEPHDSA